MDRVETPGISSYAIQSSTVVAQALKVLLFAGLTAIGAQIEIPHQPVPYTLQSFVVLLSGAILGKEKGGMSQLLYLAAGAFGMPVFAGGASGILKLVGPTGGYLLGFPVAAFVIGYLIGQQKSFVWSLVSMTVGLFIIFSLGTIYLNMLYIHQWSYSITNGFLIFTWWDALKVLSAATIYYKISRK